jgi:sec-independent protein translocase protein TatA
LIILVIVIIIFGTSKVSGIGKSLGTAIRDFRNSVRGESPDEDKPINENPEEAGKPNE